jgi:hypothetical protein
MLPILMLTMALASEEAAPLWLSFDVLNPDASGHHRILHLEDVLAKKKPVRDVPDARAVLVFATTLDDCTATQGLCAKVGAIARAAQSEGGLVVGILLESAENASRARKEIPSAHHPFPIAEDGYGITRHALKLDRPGEMIVINSQGRFVRFSPPSESGRDLDKKLDEVKRSFLAVLARDKEDEQ